MRTRKAAWIAGLTAILAPALPTGPARAEDIETAYASAPLERDLSKILSGRVETADFVVHFRPGSAADDARDAAVKRLTELWTKLCARLDVKPPGRTDVFLYDSATELTRLTGAQSGEPAAIDGGLHLVADRPEAAAAMVRLLEPRWARAGDRIGGAIEPGHVAKLHMICRGGQLDATLDGKPLVSAKVPSGAGAVTLGVESGRLSVRDLRIREVPADPDAAQAAAWTFPLRDGAGAWKPDLEGRWTIADGALEGVRYGRFSRDALPVGLDDLELDCSLRVSEGALAEVGVHVTDAGASTRILFLQSSIRLALYDAGGKYTGGRLAVGPIPAMREGLSEALAAEVEGRALAPIARAMLDRGLVPPLDQILKRGTPTVDQLVRAGGTMPGTEVARRRLLLGSFVAFCAGERAGIAKYRDFHFDYVDASATATPLGDVATLDEAWRQSLREVRRTPEEARKTERDLGLDVPTASWQDYSSVVKEKKIATAGGGHWTQGDLLVWEGPSGAASAAAAPVQAGRATLPDPAPVSGAMRATVRFAEGSRVRLKMIARDGKEASAVVSASGAQLVGPDGTGLAKSAFPLEAGRAYDVLLVLESGAGRLYVDGALVAEARGLAAGPGIWAIEAEGRRVEARAPAARGL